MKRLVTLGEREGEKRERVKERETGGRETVLCAAVKPEPKRN